MAEKVCCPGPIGGNNGNSAGGFREAVCVHTKKVYDSCRSKECLRDIRVYLTRDAQELINAGGIASVKPREAELLCVSIDVERIQFNRGFYSVDIRFFYRIECEISCVIGRPRIADWRYLTNVLYCSAAKAARASFPRSISRTAAMYSCGLTATSRLRS